MKPDAAINPPSAADSVAVTGVAELPRVWLVMGYRAGENTQIRALAEALGWPFEVKTIQHRRGAFVTNLCRGTGLNGIVKHGSSALLSPWPDLVISAGMRNEPVCRWIRRQAGGATRIVHVGRPWAKPQQFDLVVTTPQYRTPDHPHVLQNKMTLHGVTDKQLAQEASRWAPRFEHLPGPMIGVMVGGNSGPYTLGMKAGHRLGEQASRLASSLGGSLLISSSSRTSKQALVACESALQVPSYVYKWTSDDLDNPYNGILAMADSLIVTGDSVAMLAEACATGKPLHIFDSGRGPVSMQALARDDRAALKDIAWQQADMDFRLSAYLYWQMMRWGPNRLSRDLGLVHRELIASGRAVWLGEEFPVSRKSPPTGDIERAVQRVRALFP